MNTLAALLLATPVFGFALTTPSATAPATVLSVQPAAQLLWASPRLLLEEADTPDPGASEAEAEPEGEAEAENEDAPEEAGEAETEETDAEEAETEEADAEEAETEEADAEEAEREEAEEEPPPPPVESEEEEEVTAATPAPVAGPPVTTSAPTLSPRLEEEGDDEDTQAEATELPGASFDEADNMREQRARLRTAHMTLGITTWLSMAATLTLGAIQYHDEYGASDYDQTRCAQGTAILGQWNCGTPFAHLFSVLLTTSLYSATFGLSVRMEQNESEWMQERRRDNRRLRLHRTLRWVHFALMAAQIVEGLIFANLGNMGVDERENHGLLRGLNAVHIAVGSATFLTVSAAGGLMLF